MKLETTRTCMRCGRPVGLLSKSVARAYTTELTKTGVGPVCKATQSCKLAASKAEGEE